MKSSGTVVAGGIKVLLRHPKEESFSVNVMKGKFWCMLSWLCLILGKYLATNVKKGYSQMGNEFTTRGWIFVYSVSGTEGYTS